MTDVNDVAGFEDGIVLSAEEPPDVHFEDFPFARDGEDMRILIPGVLSGVERFDEGQVFTPADARIADVAAKPYGWLALLLLHRLALLALEQRSLCFATRAGLGDATGGDQGEDDAEDEVAHE
jgi:hypothetical protein